MKLEATLTWILLAGQVVMSVGVLGSVGLAAAGKLKINNWSGIRLPQTTRSPETWLAAHQAALPWTIGGVVLGALAGIVAVILVLTDNQTTAMWLSIGALMIVTLALIPASMAAVRAADRL